MPEKVNKFEVGELIDYSRYVGLIGTTKLAIVLEVEIDDSYANPRALYRIYKQNTQEQEAWISERWLDKVE